MKIRDNDRFLSVERYNERLPFSLNELQSCASLHFKEERDIRKQNMDKVAKMHGKDKIANVFLVDKGHENGAELHVVTFNGLIYVLNQGKAENRQTNALCTVLIARVNQAARLYEAVGLKAPAYVIEACRKNQQIGLNNDVAKTA